MQRAPGIALVVVDVDGVLTGGETAPLDLELMGRLAAMNAAARQGRGAAVTLCSGRPAPYVEAILQVIDAHTPAVFEGGAGVYVPRERRWVTHPRLGEHGGFRECRRRLQAAAAGGGRFFLQPGREHTASVFPAGSAPADLARLRSEVAAVLGPLAADMELTLSASCVSVAPRGCDKAAGLQLLARASGIEPGAMLGIGVSEVDASFLAATGLSAAPANAVEAIRRAVHYLSPLPASAGLRGILLHFGLLA